MNKMEFISENQKTKTRSNNQDVAANPATLLNISLTQTSFDRETVWNESLNASQINN